MLESQLNVPNIKTERDFSGEKLNNIRLIDVAAELGLQEYSSALRRSRGVGLVLVHPFFDFQRHRGYGFLSKPNFATYAKYVGKLRQLVQKASARNLPILVFQETAEASMVLEDNKVTSRRPLNRLNKYYREVLGLSSADVFFVLTPKTSPIPLTTNRILSPYRESCSDIEGKGLFFPDIYAKEYQRRFFCDFTGRLKKAGLTNALMAGANIGARPNLGSNYYDANYVPPNSYFAFIPWRLSDHYAVKRKERGWDQPHFLEKYSPTGCLADAIRAFAYSGIDMQITKATYPLTIPDF